jgi:coenzyme F420-reducing hydrogenase delta subunit
LLQILCICRRRPGRFHASELSKTKKKIQAVKKTLESLGIEPERVEMFNLSSAMGPRFAEIAEEMTQRVRALGPTPVVERLTSAA